MILTRNNIKEFLNSHDYDIRKSQNGRWIDQKCTPDVLSVVSDCIVNFFTNVLHNDKNKTFVIKDIWDYDYTSEYGISLFNKSDVHEKTARNEYDKFFGQPMKLLANAHILVEEKQGNKNIYRVSNYNVLNYIALSDKNSLYFLHDYIEKVLTDSCIIQHFNNFFTKQDNEEFNKLKEIFIAFTKNNTKIKADFEPKRIFTKVLNVLSFQRKAKGTQKGHLSKHIITYDMLFYNRTNFRDDYSEKPKNITRQEHLINTPFLNNKSMNYHVEKAKRYVKDFNDSLGYNSELLFELNPFNKVELRKHNKINATHAHHIFMKSDYPEIADYKENLILLTPNEHLLKAHPTSTHTIDETYQFLFLLSKLAIIHMSEKTFGDSSIYSLDNFKDVINIGKNGEFTSETYEQTYVKIQQLYTQTIDIKYINVTNNLG